MTSEAADRRRAPRLAIELPVELDQGTGRTRDMSTTGVYFETPQALAPGVSIRLSLMLADAAVFVGEHPAPAPLRLECEGRIVRVEHREDAVGVAAALSFCRLVPYADPGRLADPLARRDGFV